MRFWIVEWLIRDESERILEEKRRDSAPSIHLEVLKNCKQAVETSGRVADEPAWIQNRLILEHYGYTEERGAEADWTQKVVLLNTT